MDQLHNMQVDHAYLRDLMEGEAYLDMDDPPQDPDSYTDEEHLHTDIDEQLSENDDTPLPTTSRLPNVDESTSKEWKRRQRRRGIVGPPALMLGDESTWSRGRTMDRSDDDAGEEIRSVGSVGGIEGEEGLDVAAGGMWSRFLDTLPETWKTNLTSTSISSSRPTNLVSAIPAISAIPFLPSLRGRSRSMSPPRSSSTFTMSSSDAKQDLPPAFEERFRWKICSSGLLDVAPKTSVGLRDGGGGGGGDGGLVIAEGRTTATTTTRPRSYSSTSSSSYITSLTHLSRTAPWDRIDVFLATLVTIGGVWRIVGWIWVEVVTALTIMFCATLVGFVGEERVQRGRRKREEREAEKKAREETIKRNAAEQESLQAMALMSLDAFILQSDQLDEQIGMGLRLLEENTSSESTIATSSLRERLDCILKSLSDRISSATASLLPLASETELAGLAEMYGIDEMRLVLGAMSPVQEDNDGQLLGGFETPLDEQGNAFESFSNHSMSSPPTRSISSTWSKGYNPATSYPFSPFDSADADTRHVRLSQSMSYSPGANLLSPTEDRLTPLPRRSPLPGQRASWHERRIASPSPASPSMWERPTIGALPSYGTPSRPGKTTRWPSTVTEERDDAEDTTALGFQSLSRESFKGSRLSFSSVDDASDIMPTSSPPRPTHKLRELRLSQSGITGFSAVAGGVENGAPISRSAAAEDRQRKRRSLQDTGYQRRLPGPFNGFREGGRPLSMNLDVPLYLDLERDPQVSLSRASSLPGRRYGHLPSHSVPNARNLAAAAAAAAAPSPKPSLSRGNSFRSENVGQSTRRRPRAGSDTAASMDHPLTAAGLKASFFAMHRKRREAVCCLLALQFNNPPPATAVGDSQASWDLVRSGRLDEVEIARYWANVHVLLDDLQGELKVSREDLEVVVGEARSKVGPGPTVRRTVAEGGHIPEYDNFAPRTADKVLLDDHMNALLDHLSQVERRIQAIRVQNVSDALNGHLPERWQLVRGDIGGMIGDWERGRLVINRMMGMERAMMEHEHDSEVEEVEDVEENFSNLPDIPAFLDDWNETPSTTSTPSQHVDKDLPDTNDTSGDDASKYLLDSTSPAFLPPPGLEAVFEATCVRSATKGVTTDGRKLARDERIKAMRAARERIASDVENQAPECPSSSSSSKDRSGEMVSELKNVIGELRRRKEAAVVVLGGGAGKANMMMRDGMRLNGI